MTTPMSAKTSAAGCSPMLVSMRHARQMIAPLIHDDT